ncbi:MAG: hypothetical protein AAGF20_13690 [Pseudomonadota bacterium]
MAIQQIRHGEITTKDAWQMSMPLEVWANMGITSRSFAIAIAVSVVVAVFTADRRVRVLATLCFFGFVATMINVMAGEVAQHDALDAARPQAASFWIDWALGLIKFVLLVPLLGRSPEERASSYAGPRQIDEHTWIAVPAMLEMIMVLIAVAEISLILIPWVTLDYYPARDVYAGFKLGIELLFLWGRAVSIHYRPLGQWFSDRAAKMNEATLRVVSSQAKEAANCGSGSFEVCCQGVLALDEVHEEPIGLGGHNVVEGAVAEEVRQGGVGLKSGFLADLHSRLRLVGQRLDLRNFGLDRWVGRRFWGGRGRLREHSRNS